MENENQFKELINAVDPTYQPNMTVVRPIDDSEYTIVGKCPDKESKMFC